MLLCHSAYMVLPHGSLGTHQNDYGGCNYGNNDHHAHHHWHHNGRHIAPILHVAASSHIREGERGGKWDKGLVVGHENQCSGTVLQWEREQCTLNSWWPLTLQK